MRTTGALISMHHTYHWGWLAGTQTTSTTKRRQQKALAGNTDGRTDGQDTHHVPDVRRDEAFFCSLDLLGPENCRIRVLLLLPQRLQHQVDVGPIVTQLVHWKCTRTCIDSRSNIYRMSYLVGQPADEWSSGRGGRHLD